MCSAWWRVVWQETSINDAMLLRLQLGHLSRNREEWSPRSCQNVNIKIDFRKIQQFSGRKDSGMQRIRLERNTN